MTLDDLNPRVTNAIVQAESLPAGSREAWEAFHDVSALEESIAKIAPADDLEGEIARLGAVTAALSAGEPLRALQLAGRYLAEDVAGRWVVVDGHDGTVPLGSTRGHWVPRRIRR